METISGKTKTLLCHKKGMSVGDVTKIFKTFDDRKQLKRDFEDFEMVFSI